MQPTSSQSPVSVWFQPLNEKHSDLLVSSGDNKTHWVAHPDTSKTNTTQSALFTTESTPSTNNLLLGALGNTGAMTSPVIFTLDGTNHAQTRDLSNTGGNSVPFTDVWTLYEATVILNQPNANFYAQPTEKDGWYVLLWSSDVHASVKNTPLTLRTVPRLPVSF